MIWKWEARRQEKEAGDELMMDRAEAESYQRAQKQFQGTKLTLEPEQMETNREYRRQIK